MVVVVIIGVLVAIAVPIFGTVTRNAANQAHEANIRTLAGAATMHVANVGRPADEVTFTGGDWDPDIAPSEVNNPLMQYLQTWPTVPDDADGDVREDFPIEVRDEAIAANPGGTYEVEITPAGGITVIVTEVAATTPPVQ